MTRTVSLSTTGVLAAAIAATAGAAPSSLPSPADGREAPLQTHAAPEADMDSLAAPTYQLDELVVGAKKPVISAAEGKINYNVEEDPAASSSSVLDLLRKMPGVTVDGNDNISLNGQSDFKILINGMEQPGITQNAGMILKHAPASMVTRIEIINEPGAKYDAEGVGGLINLVTEKKQRTDGYSGQIGLNIAKMASSADASFRIRQGKVSASVNAAYADNFISRQKSDIESRMELFAPDGSPASAIQRAGSMTNSFKFINGGLNLSYEPDENNIFLMNFDFNSVLPDIRLSQQDFAGSSLADMLRYMDENIDIDMRNLNITAGASYQHTFAPEHYLVANYQYVFGRNTTTSWLHYFPADTDAPYSERNFTGNYTRQHTGQLDYNLPLAEGKHFFGAGLKAIFRRNTGLGSALSDRLTGSLTPVEEGRSDFLQRQQIEAVYATYKGVFGDWTANAGVRYEHTHNSLTERAKENSRFSTDFDDVVPNASITWQAGPAASLRLNYQMRISRPTIAQLNPFAGMPVMGQYMNVGNPDLKSEKSHAVKLSYSSYGMTVGYGFGLEYHRLDGKICSVPTEKEGYLYILPMNVGSQERPELSANVYWNITPKLMLSLYGALNYTHIKGFGISNSGWGGNYGGFCNYSLPADLTISLFGGQNSRNIQLTSQYSGFYYYGLAVKKKFLREKQLEVGLSANNFLGRNIDIRQSSWSDTFRNSSKTSVEMWNVGVSVSWSFGSRKDLKDVKVNSEILNDDAAKTSGGGSLGGVGGGISPQ